MAGPATSASADPGHCWVQGGISDSAPDVSYQIKNKCSHSIRVRLRLPNGFKSSCRTIEPRGYTWWSNSGAFRYYWAENC